MGLFSFLKKKDRAKDVGLTPVGQKPEDLNNSMSKSDFPSMSNIPLPPHPDKISSEIKPGGDIPIPPTDSIGSTTLSPNPVDPAFPEIAAETPQIQEVPVSEPQEIDHLAPPPIPGEESTESPPAEEVEPEQAPAPANIAEEPINETPEVPNEEVATEVPAPTLDFALPDFTDEEIKIGEDLDSPDMDLPETEEIEKETGVVEEDKDEPEMDFTLDKQESTDDSDTKDETEKEADEEETSSFVDSKPIMKEELNVNNIKSAEHYISIVNCNFAFEKIYYSQKTLKEMTNEVQGQETGKRKVLDSLKLFHDELDIMQEKLMQVDNNLFER